MEQPSDSIARYNRKVVSFENEMGVSPKKVIQPMDNDGDDIPYQNPEHMIRLPRVGLIRKHIPVRIINPFDEAQKEIIPLLADVVLETEVPASRRGIHMSRTGDIIAQTVTKIYANLQEYASDITEKLSDSQYGGPSSVSVCSSFSYLEEVKGWKNEKDKKSLETIQLHAAAHDSKERHSEDAGIEIANMTACPCVQKTYKHALLAAKNDVRNAIENVSPLLTHSQRCTTRIDIGDIPGSFPVKKVLEILDGILVRVQSTLPRDHELLMVYRSHKKPQFMEDVVRDVLAGVFSVFKDKFPQSMIRVETTSMESIHSFDIHTRAEFHMNELRKMLESS